jgi:AbrB family looped-hinge helix DNA binding protein
MKYGRGMDVIVSKINAKGQTTIPTEVRAKLRLKPGDAVAYRHTKAGIVIHKAGVLDVAFLKLQEHALSDWQSPEADEAFLDL